MNVNNWHWTEKNINSWAHPALEKHLKESPIPFSSISVAGDIDVNNRKNRLFYFYELVVKGNWSENIGLFKHSGKFELPDFNNDSTEKDLEIQISFDDLSAFPSDNVSSFKSELKKEIWKCLADFRIEMENVYGTPKSETAKSSAKANASYVELKSEEVGKASVSSLELSFKFNASPQILKDTLTKPENIQIWSRSNVTIDKENNFSLLNGNIIGKFLIISDEKLDMKWRSADWKDGVESDVTILFQCEGSGTVCKLSQKGIPWGEKDRVENCWRDVYFNRIKMDFGYYLTVFECVYY